MLKLLLERKLGLGMGSSFRVAGFRDVWGVFSGWEKIFTLTRDLDFFWILYLEVGLQVYGAYASGIDSSGMCLDLQSDLVASLQTSPPTMLYSPNLTKTIPSTACSKKAYAYPTNHVMGSVKADAMLASGLVLTRCCDIHCLLRMERKLAAHETEHTEISSLTMSIYW